MLNAWKRVSKELIAKNPYWSYWRAEYELPNGKKAEYFSIANKPTAIIVPIHEDGRIVMVRQYRPLDDSFALEFPMGAMKEGQAMIDAARAELAEEVSLGARVMQEIGRFHASNGILEGNSVVFVATKLFENDLPADDNEEFEIVHVTADELDAYIADGNMQDGMSLATWMLARPYYQKVVDDM